MCPCGEKDLPSEYFLCLCDSVTVRVRFLSQGALARAARTHEPPVCSCSRKEALEREDGINSCITALRGSKRKRCSVVIHSLEQDGDRCKGRKEVECKALVPN